ncbi:unnamed protein product [Dimorphilus gyrociliatus]|uniref:C2H2-type domain-containing protein n=1 Tax=Dimorphilus gyrociliatus TaxID=2664684 RepID=A0A7I8VZD7_9ANNE|nr:unnamed protein product [Dimorphilus gyrociliatus]
MQLGSEEVNGMETTDDEPRGARRRKRLPERYDKSQMDDRCCMCGSIFDDLTSFVHLSDEDLSKINDTLDSFDLRWNRSCLPCWNEVQIILNGQEALKRLEKRKNDNRDSPSERQRNSPVKKPKVSSTSSSLDRSDSSGMMASATLAALANLQREQEQQRTPQSEMLSQRITSKTDDRELSASVPRLKALLERRISNEKSTTKDPSPTLRAALSSAPNSPTSVRIKEEPEELPEVTSASSLSHNPPPNVTNPLLSLLLQRKPGEAESRPNLKEVLDNIGTVRGRSATWGPENRLQYACEHCSLRLQTQSALALHKACHITGSTQLQCPICNWMHNKLAPQWRIMQSHLVKEHSIPRHTFNHFPCPDCGTVLASSAELTTHARVHERMKPNLFDVHCPICELRMVSDEEAQAHILCHTSERSKKVFRCPHCQWEHPSQPGSWRYMRSHLLSEHQDIYVRQDFSGFPCSICDSCSFLTSEGRDLHEKMHDGDAYKCVVCTTRIPRYPTEELLGQTTWLVMQKHYLCNHSENKHVRKIDENLINKAIENVMIEISPKTS